MSRILRRQLSIVARPLKESDPKLFQLLKDEQKRQLESISLIPSENFTSLAVMQALGSVFQNKYSEGYPNKRYYGGNEVIDQVELLCQQRALEAFGLDSEKWGVNVQSLSGSPANLQVYGALLKPHDRLMGLDLPHGGHLSHGYQTSSKKISAVSAYFETLPYRVDANGIVDYVQLQNQAELYRPKLIIGGGSAYPRNWEYAKLKKICDSVGAWFMFDMAHTSGLVAAGVVPSPFEHADIVTTTTHKSLRGPRGAMIFIRKGERLVGKKMVPYDLEDRINFSVFPGHQGGPHNHTIAALSTALLQTTSPEFKQYQMQVVENAQVLAETFKTLGYDLLTAGTDTHLLVLDLRSVGTDGARAERILELVNIASNKNTIPSDKSAMVPHGLRLGTPAMTTRGFSKSDFTKVAHFIHQAIQIALAIGKKTDSKKIKDFKDLVDKGECANEIAELKAKVVEFAKLFPLVVSNN